MMPKKLGLAILIGSLGFVCDLWALPQPLPFAAPRRASDRKTHQYIKEGVIIGGEAGDGFSLLGIRRKYSAQSTIERVIFDLGTLNGRPLFNQVGYFNVSIKREKTKTRLSIDFAQLQKSAVDQKKIAQIFKPSPYIKRARITFDPEDLSTNVLLELKAEVGIEIYQLATATKPSQVVVDMRRVSQGVVIQ